LAWNDAFFWRSPSREQALLERLSHHPEPRVAGWARAHRARVRDSEGLLAALEELRSDGSQGSRSLAAAIWLAWREEGA
jgi:hypothetical protein